MAATPAGAVARLAGTHSWAERIFGSSCGMKKPASLLFGRRPVHRVEGSEVLLQWGLVLDDGEWWKRDSMAMGSRPGERQSLSG